MWSIPLIYRKRLKCLHRFVRILVLGIVHSDAQIEGPPETWQVEYVASQLLGVLLVYPYVVAVVITVSVLHLENGRELFMMLALIFLAIAFFLVWYELRTGRSKEVYKRLPAKLLPTLGVIDKRLRAVAIIEMLSIVGWVIYNLVLIMSRNG